MKLAHLLLMISVLILQQNFHLSIPSALAAYHHDHHLNVSVQSHEKINGSLPAPPNSTNIHLLPDPSSCDSPPHTSPMGRFLFTNTSSMELQPHPDASINMSLSSNHSERHNSTTQKKFSFDVMDNFTDCEQTRSEKISPQDQSTLDARKLLPSSAPVNKHAAQSHSDAAAQRSTAKQSVQNSMVLSEDDVVFIDAELLRRFTPPPGANTPIHTAAQRSIARDSLQVMVIDEDDVALVSKEQLGGATPPPGATSPINMAARISIARDSVQVMVIDEDDVFLVNEQLGRATPPPGATTPIHMAAQQSIARDSVQGMVIDEDDVVLNNEEQLGRATPPPSATTPIHSAAERSVARDSA